MFYDTRCKLCDRECHVQVEIKDNKLLSIRPNKKYNEFLCPNGYNIKEILDNPNRIKSPMKKVGVNGVEKWEEISWKEAIDYCVDKIQYNVDCFGKDSLFTVKGFNKPYINLLFEMFSAKYGIKHQVSAGNICHAARAIPYKDIFNTMIEPKITSNTRNIILWGFDPLSTQRWHGIDIIDACNNGSKLHIINPKSIALSKFAQKTYKVIPGRDRYLILSLMHYIVKNKLYDQKYVEVYLENFQLFKSKLLEIDFDQLLELLSLEIEDIKVLSEILCNKGSCVIMTGNALDHNQDSYYKGLGISLLIAITGNYNVDGGMKAVSKASRKNLFRSGELAKLFNDERKILNDKILKEKSSQHTRFTYYSGQDILYKCKKNELTTGIIMGANPVVSWADSFKTIEAFKNLDFLAVQDFILTPTAKLADIVLPAATYLEKESLVIDGMDNIYYIPKLIENNINYDSLDLMLDLMNALSINIPWKNSEEFWDYNLEPYNTSFKEIKVSGNIEGESHKKSKLSSESTSNFKQINLDIETIDRVSWKELLNLDVEKSSTEYPHYLTTYKPSYRFLSMINSKNQMEPTALISNKIAKEKTLKDGDRVKISTKTGTAEFYVKVDDTAQKDTILIENGFWNTDNNIKNALISCANNLTDSSYDGKPKIPAFGTRGIPCSVIQIL